MITTKKLLSWTLLLIWIPVAIEAVALFFQKYQLYMVARCLIGPSLFFVSVIYEGDNFSKRFLVIAILSAWLADWLTLFGDFIPINDFNIPYIGLSFFSASYVGFGCCLFDVNNKYSFGYIVLLLFLLLSTILNFLFLYSPSELQIEVGFLQSLLHFTCILFWGFAVLGSRKLLYSHSWYYFLFSFLIAVLGNATYFLDVYYFHRAHKILDSLVVLGHGGYLYFFFKGLQAVGKSGIKIWQ